MKRLLLILSLATVVLSNRAANAVVPQATAARFCQLLVCDTDERIISLQAFLSKNPVGTCDSLTTEQLFFDYVFHYGGWQTLCISPIATVSKPIGTLLAANCPSRFLQNIAAICRKSLSACRQR